MIFFYLDPNLFLTLNFILISPFILITNIEQNKVLDYD